MKFTYQPEGAALREWDFRPDKMMNPEAELLERLTDLTFVQWQNQVLEGSVRCIRALLFVMLKRSTPGIKYEDVQFSMSEVDFTLDADEKAILAATLEKKRDSGEELSDAEQDALDKYLGDDEAPKAGGPVPVSSVA